jgi:hypothetical protein
MTVLDNDISIFSKNYIEKLAYRANELITTPLENLVSKCQSVDNNILNIALKTLNFNNSNDDKRKAVILSQMSSNAKTWDSMEAKYNRF